MNNKALKYKIIIGVLIAAIIAASGFFISVKFFPADSENAIISRLDFANTEWIEKIISKNVPLYKNDFLVNAAYVYTNEDDKLVLTYSTKAEMNDLRTHFMSKLTDAKADGTNDEGNLSLTGFSGSRKVKVRNYFSEVTNVIEVTMVFDGGNKQILREKVKERFPEEAFTGNVVLSKFLTGESTSGYVLYEYDQYSDRFYADIPIFSRSYSSSYTLDELTQSINDLSKDYTDEATAVIGNGEALIQENGYLLTLSAVKVNTDVRVVLTAQLRPTANKDK